MPTATPRIEKNARPGWVVSEREASVSARPIVRYGDSREEEPRRRGGHGAPRRKTKTTRRSSAGLPPFQPPGTRRSGGLPPRFLFLLGAPRPPRLRGSSVSSSSYRQLRQRRVHVLDPH